MHELIKLHNIDGIYPLVGAVLLCWICVILSCLIDFWSGISTARILGEKLASHRFRRTMIKIGDYIRVMLFALMFDTLASFFSAYSLPCASMLAAAAAIFIEGYSVRENAQRKKSGADIMIDIAQATAKAAATHCGLGNLAASVSDIIDEKL